MGKGFYLVGFFTKGRKAQWTVDRAKPFEFDRINGTVESKPFQGLSDCQWAKEWMFIEEKDISDIDKELELRKWLNGIWKDWCKIHKRKYQHILKE